MRTLIFVFLLLFSVSAFSGTQVVSSYPNLTKDYAIEIFSFNEFVFADRTKIKMVVLPRDRTVTRNFAFALGMTSVRFFEKAEHSFSTGKLNLLYIAESELDVVRFVSRTPGAVGYVQDTFIVKRASVPSIINIR